MTLAREIGCLTPVRKDKSARRLLPGGNDICTRDCSAGATPAEMVDNGSITLDNALDVQIASKAGIGNLVIFQAPDGSFDSLRS